MEDFIHTNFRTEVSLFQGIVADQPSASITSLPVDVLVLILSYLTYHEVATIRTVCKRMNEACMSHLTSGYFKVRQLVEETYKTVVSKMPLRQAMRDAHPLRDSESLLIRMRGTYICE